MKILNKAITVNWNDGYDYDYGLRTTSLRQYPYTRPPSMLVSTKLYDWLETQQPYCILESFKRNHVLFLRPKFRHFNSRSIAKNVIQTYNNSS